MKKSKALFLDRDGVINEDVKYPHLPEHIRFCEGIFALCEAAIAKGYLIIVVTNQAGVAKGYFSENDVILLHKWMSEQFKRKNIEITAFYYCPFHEKGTVEPYAIASEYRKPNPGMFLQAAKEYNIDITKSLMIGDKESDRIKLTGLRSIILKSGYTPEMFDIDSLQNVLPLL